MIDDKMIDDKMIDHLYSNIILVFPMQTEVFYMSFTSVEILKIGLNKDF